MPSTTLRASAHRGVHIAVRDCVTDPIGPDLGFYAARS
jgi:hypothetical protein